MDPDMPLEDFLTGMGVLPSALILDTWGNAIEDPDVLDRCRETLMRHILDRPWMTFGTLGHTPEFKNLIRRINGVLEVINQSMNIDKALNLQVGKVTKTWKVSRLWVAPRLFELALLQEYESTSTTRMGVGAWMSLSARVVLLHLRGSSSTF